MNTPVKIVILKEDPNEDTRRFLSMQEDYDGLRELLGYVIATRSTSGEYVASEYWRSRNEIVPLGCPETDKEKKFAEIEERIVGNTGVIAHFFRLPVEKLF